MRIEDQHEGIAIGGRLGDLTGTERAAAAGAVLDDHLLPERL